MAQQKTELCCLFCNFSFMVLKYL